MLETFPLQHLGCYTSAYPSHKHQIAVINTQPITQILQPGRDLVEKHHS